MHVDDDFEIYDDFETSTPFSLIACRPCCCWLCAVFVCLSSKHANESDNARCCRRLIVQPFSACHIRYGFQVQGFSDRHNKDFTAFTIQKVDKRNLSDNTRKTSAIVYDHYRYSCVCVCLHAFCAQIS